MESSLIAQSGKSGTARQIKSNFYKLMSKGPTRGGNSTSLYSHKSFAFLCVLCGKKKPLIATLLS